MFKEARRALSLTPAARRSFYVSSGDSHALAPGHRDGVRGRRVAARAAPAEPRLTGRAVACRRRAVRPHLCKGPLLRVGGALLLPPADCGRGVLPRAVGRAPGPQGAGRLSRLRARRLSLPPDVRASPTASWRTRCWTGTRRRRRSKSATLVRLFFGRQRDSRLFAHPRLCRRQATANRRCCTAWPRARSARPRTVRGCVFPLPPPNLIMIPFVPKSRPRCCSAKPTTAAPRTCGPAG